MSETSSENLTWVTIPDLAEQLGQTVGRVRRLLDERYLISSRRTGVQAVPADFIVGGRALPALRGTIIALQDAGFSDDEIIDWLFAPEDSLGRSPMQALLAGHKSEVRRVARTLA